jgi:hypothetical protein
MSGAEAAIVGGGDIGAASLSTLSLNQTNGQYDAVTGAYDTIILDGAQASLSGMDDAVFFAGASSLNLTGTHESLYFGAALGQAQISGFDIGDVLHLSAADWSSFAALQGSGDLYQAGADTKIALDNNNVITLSGVQASTLAAVNFAFA